MIAHHRRVLAAADLACTFATMGERLSPYSANAADSASSRSLRSLGRRVLCRDSSLPCTEGTAWSACPRPPPQSAPGPSPTAWALLDAGRPSRQAVSARATAPARQAALSSAVLQPSPMLGVMLWPASPTRATRPPSAARVGGPPSRTQLARRRTTTALAPDTAAAKSGSSSASSASIAARPADSVASPASAFQLPCPASPPASSRGSSPGQRCAAESKMTSVACQLAGCGPAGGALAPPASTAPGLELPWLWGPR
mmetsp:Transcript_22932/g.62214  ORF Transcript_22932/g.62214 Transcript_22932/m.62214 type:complete len:256 (+) Transcript_22932:1855-2622(+)